MTPFVDHFVVPLHATDAAGRLFYAELFRYAHDTYERFMAQRGWPLPALIREGALGLPIVHAEADYLAPVCHGDAMEVRLWVERLGEGSFTLAYRFLGPDGREVARARTVHAAVGAQGGTHLPTGLRDVLSPWLGPVSDQP